jgi:hypothetical protein
MVLILSFWDRQAKNGTATFALFGFQYTAQLTERKKAYFTSLIKLLRGDDNPVHVDYYFQPADPKTNVHDYTILLVLY